MADPIKMMASHSQGNDGALGPEDYQQILDLIKAKDPRGMQLAQTFSPEETKAFINFQSSGQAKDVGFFGKAFPLEPQRKDTAIAGGVPYIGEVGPEDALLGGQALGAGKRVARAGLSGMADSLGKSVFHPLSGGLAGGLKGILNELGFGSGAASAAGLGVEGAMKAIPGFTAEEVAGLKKAGYTDETLGRMGSRGISNGPPPIGAAPGSVVQRKPMSMAGRPGNGLSSGEEAGVNSLDELFNLTGNKSPNPMGHGTMKGELGGHDTAGLRSQPNVNLRRTVGDTREQVMRGVGGDNSYQDPRSISVEYGNTPENTRSVEAIQDEIKRKLDAAETARKTKRRTPK